MNELEELRKGRQEVKHRFPVLPQDSKHIMSSPVTYREMPNFSDLSLHLAVFDASEDNPGAASCFSSAAVNTSYHRVRCVMGSPIRVEGQISKSCPSSLPLLYID